MARGVKAAMQLQLVELGLPFVGFGPDAAKVAMDKHQTRVLASEHGVAIATGSVVHPWQPPTLPRPLRAEAIG